jgi:hypothetical protein
MEEFDYYYISVRETYKECTYLSQIRVAWIPLDYTLLFSDSSFHIKVKGKVLVWKGGHDREVFLNS